MDAWARLAQARVARFATIAPDGGPALVPVCFAVAEAEGVIYHAIDHKPKSTRRPARIRNLELHPRASLLADHYDDADWTALWWVRADGSGRVLEPGDPEAVRAIALLSAKHRQQQPTGAVLAIDVERWSGWSAMPSA